MTTEDVVREYSKRQSIRETARELEISQSVVRKCLITHGLLETQRTRDIALLEKAGKTRTEIADALEISTSCVDANSAYVRGTYLKPSTTKNAEAIRRHRARKTK